MNDVVGAGFKPALTRYCWCTGAVFVQYMPFSYELYLHVRVANASIVIKGKGRGEKSFASVHYHSISHRFVFILDSNMYSDNGILRAFVVIFEAVKSMAIVFSLS